MDSDWASVPTWPFFVVRSRWRRCMTRTSAYDAPRSRAVSRALVQKSHMRIAVRSSVKFGLWNGRLYDLRQSELLSIPATQEIARALVIAALRRIRHGPRRP